MYEQVLEQTERLNAQMDRHFSPPQDTTSEKVEEMMRLDLLIERFIDVFEGKTAASVYFFGVWEARSLVEGGDGNII